jgi:hypothetical protein
MCAGQKRNLLLASLVLAGLLGVSDAVAQGSEDPKLQAVELTESSQRPNLTLAKMCERVDKLTPTSPGMAFSVSIGQIYCFSSFDPVSQPSQIYHRWYRRDQLSTQTRLRIYPPKWATYSVIHLRESDIGPWRVEITDQNGRVFDVLRFSIVD